MDFGKTLTVWNEMISDIRKVGKIKTDFNSVLVPVLISGAISGFFFGIGYSLFFLGFANAPFLSVLGIILGPIVWLTFLVIINSFYFLITAVFGAKKTKMDNFFGPQSIIHSFFSIILGIIFAVSGMLSVVNSTASIVFFSIGGVLFTAYYLWVMSYLLHFQTGFSKQKSLGIGIIIPLTSILLYVLTRTLLFLVPTP
jgi:hypothetical protein